MSELLVLTDSSNKTCDGNSAKKPGKLRFTFPTFQSLQNNISSNKITKAIDKLNTVYSELISAVEISEKIKAEEEARNKMLGVIQEEANLENEKMVSRITEVDEVNKRLKNIKIELLKLAGRIGKYKDQYGINVQKGFAQKPPRAISVKQLYTSVYKELMNKIDLYKISMKDGVEFPQEANAKATKKEQPPVQNDGVKKWKKLFDGNSIQENVTVVVNKTEKKEDEEEMVPNNSGKLSEEDLEYRRMLGQLGDELELVRSYEKNPENVPNQFRDGVKQRANKLRTMLSDLTGIKTQETQEIEYTIGNTDFQNLIDKVTGYVTPPTKEEHMKTEESLKEYYSDDNVTTKMRELAEKDILYTFNQGMNQIIATEAKQNEQEAMESIDRSNLEVAKVNKKIQERALTDSISKEQTKDDAIKTLNGYVEMNDKIEQEQESKMQELKKSAYIIARTLAAHNTAIDLNEKNKIADMSFNEATRLAARNTAIDLNEKNKLADSSFAEATRLAARNTAIDLNERDKMAESSFIEARRLAAQNTAIDLHNLYQMASSSYEEATRLAARNTAIDLNELNQIAESSFIEARRLAAQNTAIDLNSADNIISSAYEEALRLAALNTAIDLNELNQIAESSSVEALRLAARNTAIDLNEINQILESSYLEALRLAANNTAIDFNEQDKIAKTASQYAVILASENAKQELLEKKEKLSQELNSVNSSLEALNKKIDEYNSGKIVETAPTVNVEEKKEKSIIIPIEEIKASAEQEAQRMFNDIKVEQTKIEKPKRAVAKSKTAKEKKQLENITILPISNKYGEQTNNPRPILATVTRIDNMQKNGQSMLGEIETFENKYVSENDEYLGNLNDYLNDIINQHETPTPVVAEQTSNATEIADDSVEKPVFDFEAA